MTNEDSYNSKYTGVEIDGTVAGKSKAVSTVASLQQEITEDLTPDKIFIVTNDGENSNTMWRYSGSGTAFYQIGGTGGGGGGGGGISLYDDPENVPADAPRLVGIFVSGNPVYKVTYINVDVPNKTLKIKS